jgi:hypothetical protein
MLQLSHDALEGKCKDLEEQYKKQARIPKAAKYEIFVYAEWDGESQRRISTAMEISRGDLKEKKNARNITARSKKAKELIRKWQPRSWKKLKARQIADES